MTRSSFAASFLAGDLHYLPAPVEGINQKDKQQTTRLLLACGCLRKLAP